MDYTFSDVYDKSVSLDLTFEVSLYSNETWYTIFVVKIWNEGFVYEQKKVFKAI